MAYKVFQNGFPLNASELNNYLMNQSVMVFATTTARDADLTAPTEGMIVWLQDANKFVYYTGSAWTDVVTGNGANAIINGAFDIWQRGTSGAGYVSGGGFVADRWQGIRGGAAAGMTMSRQAAQNTALPGVQYCMRMQRDSGNTSTQDVRLFYSMESTNSIPLAGKQVTLSYYVRKGANYSGGDVIANLYSGTGTDQNLGITGFTSVTTVAAATRTVASLTTDWTRVEATATVSAAATQLGMMIYFTPTGTAGTNDYIEITGVQLEVGSAASLFKRNASNIQGELAACQRYYAKSYDQGTAPGSAVAAGAFTLTVGTNTTGYLMQSCRFPVKMRTAPTITSYDYAGASGKVYKGDNGKAAYVTAIGDAGSQHGTGDATSANEMSFHYVADAEL